MNNQKKIIALSGGFDPPNAAHVAMIIDASNIGDVVIMTDEDGYKTEHLVITNYIKGETDAKGYTPKTSRTILIDNYGKRTLVHDYRTMEVVA